jgi:hypothetical protein
MHGTPCAVTVSEGALGAQYFSKYLRGMTDAMAVRLESGGHAL